MPVEFSYRKTGNNKTELTAALSGEIDHHSAAEMRILTDGELARTMPAVLNFDMSSVTFMDSSGIGLILGRSRTMQAWNGRVRISAPSERVARILKLSGLGALISAGRNNNSGNDPGKSSGASERGGKQ